MSGDMEKWDGLAKVLGLQPGESLMDAAQRVLAQLGHALAKSSGRVNEQRARAEKAEKERDEAIDKAIDYMAACTKAETERDELRREVADLLGENLTPEEEAAAKDLAERGMVKFNASLDLMRERDAATGALATAHAAIRTIVKQEHDANLEKYDCPSAQLRWAIEEAEELLSSPAVDLAARHDAEVTRRALEKAAQAFNATNHFETITRHEAERLVRALATPTPEKP